MMDLDRDLTEHGERWRATQVPPKVDMQRATAPARNRRGRIALVAAVLTVAVTASVLFIATQTEPNHSVRIATPPPAARVTAVAPGVIDLSPTVSLVQAASLADGKVWVTGNAPDPVTGRAQLLELDQRSGELVAAIRLPVNAPFAIAVTDRAVWLRGEQRRSTYLVKVDIRTRRVVGTVRMHLDGGLAVTPQAVWALDGAKLLGIDPKTLRTVATIPLPGGFYPPLFVTSGPLGVWLANGYNGTVLHVDEAKHAIDRVVTVGGRPSKLVELGDSVWVIAETSLVQVRAADGTVVRTVPLGRRTADLATDGSSLFAAGDGPNRLEQVDPATGNVTPVALSELVKTGSGVATDLTTGEVWVSAGSLVVRAVPATYEGGCPPGEVPSPVGPPPSCVAAKVAAGSN